MEPSSTNLYTAMKAYLRRHSRKALLAILLAAACFTTGIHPVCAAPAAPGLRSFHQPDGSTFEGRLLGDEFFNWYEAADGHPIVYDQNTKLWTYALQTDEGVSVSSGVAVSNAPSPGHPWRPGVPTEEKKARETREYTASVPTVRRSQIRGQGNLAVTANIAMLLTGFSDRTTQPTKSASEFESRFFDISDPAAFTMANLYRQMSYNLHTPSSGPAGIQEWATAPNTHDYYGGGPQAAGTTREDGTRVRELVNWRVTNADASIDFGPYDTDNDGFVDLVCVVFQGTDQAGGGPVEDIWPIRWTLGAATSSGGAGAYQSTDRNSAGNTVKINDFIVIPELSAPQPGNPTPLTTIGLLCHEYGHGFGWPDLYDPPGADSASQGLGKFCLMAGGNWNKSSGGISGDRPCWANAYLRMQCGWVAPQIPTTNLQDYRINEAKRENQVIRLTKDGGNLNEFYLLERRTPTGFDEGMPGGGLFIWHVDTAVPNNQNEWWFISPTDQRTTGGHCRVALEQADSRFDLEKNNGQGDANDPFHPGNDFADSTVPSSRNYNNQPTNVAVRNIRSAGEDYLADLYVKADAAFPEVQFTNPANGLTYVTVSSLQGTATDNAGVATVKTALRRNGGGSSGEEWYDWTVDDWSSDPYDAGRYEKTASGTTSWSVNVVTGRITPGSYTFFAKARDTSGGESTWKYIGFSVVTNPSHPDIRYSSPAAHTNLNSTSPGSFTGTVANYTGASAKRFIIERVAETPGAAGSYLVWSSNTFGSPGEFGAQHQMDQNNSLSTWTVSLAGRGLGRGRYVMWAKLYTADLRESPWQQRAFRVDYPPEVAILSPAPGASLRSLGPVTGTCLEPTGTGAQGGGVRLTFTDGIGRYWTGSAWSPSSFILTALISNGSWTFDSVPSGANLGSGIFYITASLTTTTGESAPPGPQNQIQFRIDLSPPTAAIASPLSGTMVTTAVLPPFNGTAGDPGGVAWVNAYIRRASDLAYWTGYGWSYDSSEPDDAGQPAPLVVVLPTSYNAGTGAWSCNAPMPRPGLDMLAGNYTFIILAGDRAGNYVQVDAPVVVDYHATFVWNGSYTPDWNLSWNWRDEAGNYVPRSPGQYDIALIGSGEVNAQQSRAVHSLRITGGIVNFSNAPAAPTIITSLTPSVWSGGTINGTLRIPVGTQLSINAGAGRILGPLGIFENLGVVTQEADAPITGYAQVRVENKFGGIWRINGGGDPFDNYYGGHTFRNEGLLEKTGAGTVTLNDWFFDMPNESRSSGGILDFAGESLFPSGALLSGAATIWWSGHEDLQGAATQTAAVMALTGGNLTCGANATLIGTWNWEGGIIENTMHVFSGSTLKIQGPAGRTLGAGAVLANEGTVRWIGPGAIIGYGSSTITNAACARFEVMNGGDLFDDYFGCNVFQNDGLFVKVSGAAATILNQWTFHNPGELKTEFGPLEVNAPLPLPPGAKLSGTGTQKWLSDIITLTGTTTLTCPLELDGATVNAAGPGILTNDWTWKSGDLNGQINLPVGKRLTVQGAGEHWLGAGSVVNNFGTMKWEGPAPVIGYGSITWNNKPGSRVSFNADGEPFADYFGSNMLVNESTINKTGGGGITKVNYWEVRNSNEIRADAGGLDFSTVVHWLNGTRLRGPGTIRQRSQTYLDGPSVLEAPVQFYEGTVTAAPAGSISGALEWRAGDLEGTLNIATGATFTVTTANAKQLDAGAVVRNGGTLVFPGGSTLLGFGSATIHNLAGATLRIAPGVVFSEFFGSNAIHNDGTLELTGTGTVTSPWNFSQSATGSLRVPIAAAGPGLTSGVLQSNLSTLAGNFTAVVPAGLTPPANAEFFPLTYASHTGAFTTVLASSGGTWQGTYESARVKIKVTGGQSFPSWAAAAGLTGANALPNADPDKDGQTNFGEFAFNSSPTAGGAAPQSSSTETIGGQPWLTLHYRRWTEREAAGVTYTPEGSSSLEDWGSPGVLDELDPAAPVIPGSTARRCRIPQNGALKFLRVTTATP